MRPLAEAWRSAWTSNPLNKAGACLAGSSGGAVTVDGRVSSQFLSSLLLVGAALPRGLEIEVTDRSRLAATRSSPRAPCRSSASASSSATSARRSRNGYGAALSEVTVGGDWSAMGAWSCINQLTSSRIQGATCGLSPQADEALQAVLDASFGETDRTIDVAPMPDQFRTSPATRRSEPGPRDWWRRERPRQRV